MLLDFSIYFSSLVKVIPTGEEPFKLKPALEDLKHLILKTSVHRNDFYGISFFLNSCPNLEMLTIDLNTPARIFPVSFLSFVFS